MNTSTHQYNLNIQRKHWVIITHLKLEVLGNITYKFIQMMKNITGTFYFEGICTLSLCQSIWEWKKIDYRD